MRDSYDQPVLHIHRSERADALVAALGAVLRTPTGDPFQAETVAVPSRGVERWLAQQLSHVLGARDSDGVCANVIFPSYTRLLDETVAEADDDYAEAVERWSPERAVWPLLQAIDRCAPTEPWCGVLAAHLGLNRATTAHEGRRFAVAAKLAGLFDRYGRSRPGLIDAWASGRDEQGDGTPLPDDLRWQAQLWRELRDEIGSPSPAELLESACAKVSDGPAFSIFGATRISPARVRILQALSEHRDIHLWMHHASPALWQAAAGRRPGARREQSVPVHHPLLASMSRDVYELQQLLEQIPHESTHHPIPPRPDTVLGRLQRQLAGDEVPIERTTIAADDRSLQVHAAHGAARQVEVVREAILGLLAADPTLEPRDIVIMCPDVEQFAPLVAASFGMTEEPGAHPAAGLRVRLADRALHQTNPLLGLLGNLLELAAGRVTATQLLDLAGTSPVRRRFGFDDDDIERLRIWTVAAGARWGLDAPHRDAYGLRAIGQGTWRAALDRLLLGVAMQDDQAWVDQAVPLDDVDSGDIELVGRFAEFVDRTEHAVDQLAQHHDVRKWTTLLDELVLALGEGDQPWQAIQLRRELDELAESAVDQAVSLGLADITALLQSLLAGRPSRASFRTGTLTVCTLVPMRSVPHRVVCLVGMDDGAFPRQGIADGDDVLARAPRTGERDVRSEDRQLFLDAICAAEEHLVIAYTGADPRTGAPVPPCVPLGELLDAVDASEVGADGEKARDRIVVHHPLQPFDARNFRRAALGTPQPFSFDPSGLAGARAAVGERVPVAPLVASALAPPQPADTISLDDLTRFLQHPARGFLRQRLGIAISSSEEDPDDALPVELDGLQRWAIGDRVLRACLAGVPVHTAAHLEYLRGFLPPGQLGRETIRTIGAQVDELLAWCADERHVEARSVDVSVPLNDGRVLAGTVPGVRADVVLSVVYSRLAAKHRLTSWVRLLALVASTGNRDLRAVTVGRPNDRNSRSDLRGVAPEVARGVLELLVRIRDAGLREPLPLALETSLPLCREPAPHEPGERAVAGRTHLGIRPVQSRTRRARTRAHVRAVRAVRDVGAQPSSGPDAMPDETSRFGSLARSVWDMLVIAEALQ